MTAVFGITAASIAALALAFIAARRIPGWQGPGHHTPGSPPRPPRQHPAPRDWGESRLPSAEARTAQFAAVGGGVYSLEANAAGHPTGYLLSPAGERVMPGRRDGIPHADADWDLAPWDAAAVPVTPEPPLPPLPGFLPAPSQPHAAPDVRGRVHAGCEISDTGQQAALTALSEQYDAPAAFIRTNREISDEKRAELGERFREAFSRRDQAICLCGKVPDIPGEPITSEADCPAHAQVHAQMCKDCAGGWCGRAACTPGDGCACLCSTWAKPLNCPCCVDGDALRCCICERNCGSSDCRCRPAPDDTVTDMRPVPAPVAARENAAARFSLQGYVRYTMARKPPLREYVEDVIGTSPAEDWDRLLEQARAGAVSERG